MDGLRICRAVQARTSLAPDGAQGAMVPGVWQARKRGSAP